MTYFTADLFQLNCSYDKVGEAAVILLVEVDTTVVPPQRTIKQAVLLDAGLGQQSIRSLAYVIDDIEAFYICGTGTDVEFRFDSVVVSHWDRDHYYGLAQASTGLFQSEEFSWNTTDNTFSRFRYDKKNVTQTHLYSAKWIPKALSRNMNPGAADPKTGLVPVEVEAPDRDTNSWETFPKTMIGHVTTSTVLGMNVFNHSGLDAKTKVEDVKDLETLLAKNDPWKSGKGAPGLYVVGVNSILLGPKPATVPLVIDGTGKESDPDNQASILLLLVWKSIDGDLKNNPHRVSFYSGGDAEGDREEALATWLGPHTVKVVKAGHHGSRIGTSRAFIEKVKPEHFIVSAGSMNGHPVSEIIWYLDAWFSSAGGSIGGKAAKRIHATCSPYYIGYVNKKGKLVDLNSTFLRLDTFAIASPAESTDAWGQFRSRITALYDPATVKAKTDLLNEATKIYNDKTKTAVEQQQWLAAALYKLWSRWSDITYDFYPTSTSIDPEYAKTYIKQTVVAVKAVFTPTDVEISIEKAEFIPPHVTASTPIAGKPKKKKAKKKARIRRFGFAEDTDSIIKDSTVPVLPRPILLDDTGLMLSESAELEFFRGETDSRSNYSSRDSERSEDIDPAYVPPRLPLEFSEISPSSGKSGLTLPPASNWDNFLRNLYEQNLRLLSPVTIKNASSSWTGKIRFDNDFVSWLGSMFSTKYMEDIELEASGSGTAPYIETLQITAKNIVQIPTLKLIFSSAASVLQSTFSVTEAEYKSLLDSHGLYTKTTGILFCLDTAKSSADAELTLEQLSQLIELELPAWLSIFGLPKDRRLKLDVNDGAINAFWFFPATNYSTTIALQLKEASSQNGAGISGFLASLLPKVLFSDVKLIALKSATHSKEADPDASSPVWADYVTHWSELVIQTSLCLLSGDQTAASAASLPSWSTRVSIEESAITFTMQWNDTSDPLDNFLAWLGELTDSAKLFKAYYDTITSAASKTSFSLRQTSVRLDMSNKLPKICAFSLEFEVDLEWGVPPNEKGSRVPLYLSFLWRAAQSGAKALLRFKGQIWPYVTPEMVKLGTMNPTYQPFSHLKSRTKKPRYSFSLLGLPGIDEAMVNSIPKGIPTELTSINLEISTERIKFNGTISPSRPESGKVASISLGGIAFSASFILKSKRLDLSFSVIVYLWPFHGVGPSTGTLVGNIDYARGSSSSWSLSAQGQNLCMGDLHSLFPSEDAHAVVTLMENIKVPGFNIKYNYAGGVGHSFVADGVLALGHISLKLGFSSPSESSPNTPGTWDLTASLYAGFEPTWISIESVLNDIGLAKDLYDTIPDDVKNLTLKVDIDPRVELHCFKSADKEHLILSIDVKVGSFSFAFVQITSLKPPSAGLSAITKRLLKFSLDQIPSITSIPLISKFEQPFDQLAFCWTSHDLTQADVDLVNHNIFTARNDAIVFKKTSAVSGGVMSKGAHLIVVAEEENVPTAIVDYVLFKPKPVQTLVTTESDPEPSSDSSAPFTKQKGPLSISSIGLKFESGRLYITFDALIRLGAVEAKLVGFGIDFPLRNMHNFKVADISFTLDGLGLELEAPPVSMAGMLVKKGETCMGGVSISVQPYSFMAGGFYSKVPKPHGNETFRTMFVFARLDGPLVELEFASISGITGGFGYNSAMTLPSVTNVTQFPFIAATDLNPDPLLVLGSFLSGNWFSPADGPIWLAAGLDVSAFQVLDIKAVAALDFSLGDVVFGIFADCRAKIPETATKEEELFALIDIGVLAVVDFGKGVFHFEGQLTPKSFLLDRSCHLTGGFALCYWFEGSGLDGDWVFTIGGYHSAFERPKHYPKPPRVGISWQYDSSISIRGEAYFAITPKAAMGGGRLDLVFATTHLNANLSAWADFLINYRPFFFTAEVGISVYVKFSASILGIDAEYETDFGALLYLHGPPVAGRAHINWCIHSFDIYFGDSAPESKALNWTQFHELLQQNGVNSPSAKAQDHVISPTGGLIAPPTGQPSVTVESTSGWQVLGSAFSFSIASLFPITEVQYSLGTVGAKAIYKHTAQSPHIKPMHITDKDIVKSTLSVYISPDPDEMFFKLMPIFKAVPTALWGKYNEKEDPSTGATPADLLNSKNGTMHQLMGIDFQPHSPLASNDQILPFNMRAACSESVFGPEETQPVFAFSETPTNETILAPLLKRASVTVKGAALDKTSTAARVASCWMEYCGLTGDTTVAQAYRDLISECGAQLPSGITT